MFECKWITRWSLLLGIVGLFTGCGGSGGDVPGQTTAPSTSTAPLPAAEAPAPREPGRVVAKVNGVPIHERALDEGWNFNKLQLQAQGRALSEEEEKTGRAVVLNLLIADELMIQAAKAEGMTVEPARIDAKIDELRASYGSEAEYKDSLIRAGLDDARLRQEAERRLLRELYTESITKDVKVDESEVRKVYDERKELFKEPEQVQAAFILVKSSPDDPEATRQAARKRIDDAMAQLRSGRDFADVAKEYSQAASAANGGDVGFFGRGVMVPQFEDMAFKTPVNETTDVFETVYGYNILKVLDRKEPRQLTFEEVKPTLSLNVAQQRENAKVQKKISELHAAAQIEVFEDEPEPTSPAPEQKPASEPS